MKSILTVALREAKDHLRQPWIIVAAIAFYVIFDALYFVILTGLDAALSNPQLLGLLGAQDADTFVEQIVGYVNTLVLTEPPTLASLLGAYALLNDRQNGTLPFLLLSPVSRWQLLVGKVLGCLIVPMTLHMTFGLGTSLAVSAFDVTASVPHSLPFSAGWCVAFFLGAPAWSAVLTCIAVLASSLAKDVRTSQQLISLVNGILSIAVGGGLAMAMASVGAELGLAVFGGLSFVALVALGQLVISRDVSR